MAQGEDGMLDLIEKTWQHRNDFDGIYECNKCCKHTLIKDGYSDENYFRNVVPTFKCAWCEDGEGVKVERTEKIIIAWKAS